MSNRFPPIAAQPKAAVRVKTIALPLPNLPWFELTVSLVLLILLHQA